VIEMLASTNRFVAGPLPPGPLLPEVERPTVTPPIVTWALALAVKTPAALLLIVSVQVAVFPLTVGLLQVELCEPGCGLTLVVIAPKLTGLAPDGIAVTVIVNVCAFPTSFTAVPGVIEMLASTNRFVAEPLPPGPLLPEVERLSGTPPIVT